VQIAKLRFFISLIIDQRENQDETNRGILPLPNLETKFVAANSLIGVAKVQQLSLFDTQEIQAKQRRLERLRRDHFFAKSLETKRKKRQEDELLCQEIGEILRRNKSPNVESLQSWKPYDQNASADFFDPEWMFGIKDGFDICIGNPPYVRQEQIKELKPFLSKQYECYTGVADLFVYFFERGYQLLKTGGVLSYICSNKYFRSGYGEKLRDFLGKNTTIKQLIDFGDTDVFTAIAYPSIILFSKEKPSPPAPLPRGEGGKTLTPLSPQGEGDKTVTPLSPQGEGGRGDEGILSLTWDKSQNLSEFAQVFHSQNFLMPQSALKADGWRLENTQVFDLLAKLRNVGKPLGEYVNGKFYYGIKTGFNEAFVIDRETRDKLIAEHPSSAEVIKPLLRGRDVKRWCVESVDLYLLFIPWHFPLHQDPKITGASEKAEKEFKKLYPAIYNHLLKFKTELSARNKAETGIRYEWYALQRWGANYWQEFEQPKIIYPNICKRNEFAWDKLGYYTNQKAFIIPCNDKVLLAILNSSVMTFLFDKLLPKLQGDFYEPSSIFMKDVPIPTATEAEQKAIETLVQKCLDAKGQNVGQWEQEIDEIVARLYGLSNEEMKIIIGLNTD
jgi:hypothetical protein